MNVFAQIDGDDLSAFQQANLKFTYNYPVSVEDGFSQLASLAEEQGTVRVIIQLDVPVTFEDGMESSEITSQQSRIAIVQESFLKSLSAVEAIDETTHAFKHAPYIVTTVNTDALNSLQSSPMIANIFQDIPQPPLLRDTIPLIGADDVWNPNLTGGSFTGDGWQVVIMDTGVDKNHSFFANKVISEACYSSTNPSDNSQSLCPGGVFESITPGSAMPCTGIQGCDHGTHVAGIAAGKSYQWLGNNYTGVAPDAGIIAIKVFSQFNNVGICLYGSPCVLSYTSDQMKGFDRVIDLAQDPSFNIASVNLSLGGGQFSSYCDNDVRKPFIDQLKALGIATVIASGNNGYVNAISTPACISSAISVGSTSKTDQVSSFSNSAPILDILAPGQSIASSILNNGFAVKSGTSMATPHVTGAWALMKEKAAATSTPNLSVDEGLQFLEDYGTEVADARNGLVRDRIQLDATIPVVPEFPIVMLVMVAAFVPIIIIYKKLVPTKYDF